VVTYRTSVSSERSPADVFAYLARFSNAAAWDPGVASAEDTTAGPPAPGSTYRLMVKFLGGTVPLDYRIEEIDPPQRVVLRAENAAMRSTDVIEVRPTPDGGSTVTYVASLTPKGVAAGLAPILAVVFRRIGARAAAGLRTALAP
jgi:hypothetical protein